MKKTLFSKLTILILTAILLICSCSASKSASATTYVVATTSNTSSSESTEIRQEEVYVYAESIEKVIVDMADPLLNIKTEFYSEEDYEQHIEAINEIITSLREMIFIKTPEGYEENQHVLSEAALNLYEYYNLEKCASEMCKKSLHFVQYKYEGVLDLYKVLKKKASDLDMLTEEETAYLAAVDEIMDEEYSGVMSYEYIRHLKEIGELASPERLDNQHDSLVWEINELMELFSSYNYSVSYKDEILSENYNLYAISMVSFISIYGDITNDISEEFPEYYAN